MIDIIMAALMSLSFLPYRATQDIFQQYEAATEQKLSEMTTDEKIAQVLLVRYPDVGGASALAQYSFGGYLFFAKDFAGKTTSEVQNLINSLQNTAKIPILTAVDEEGGTVVRVSSNPNLAPTRFPSPREVYAEGGLAAIAADTRQKSQTLQNLGLNLNLAPVVDVSTSPTDYMYSRSLGQNAKITADFARTVIETSQKFNAQALAQARKTDGGNQEIDQGTTENQKTATTQGTVSYTLKHFPGYGNNLDTHTGGSIDRRSFDDLLQTDLPPFQAGITAGAEAVLVGHNTVTALDAENPASLSPNVHVLLRQGLNFSGVVITDDIAMAAIDSDAAPTVQALLAGNDLVITSDYATSISDVRAALKTGQLSESQLNRAAKRVLAWKYYKGLFAD